MAPLTPPGYSSQRQVQISREVMRGTFKLLSEFRKVNRSFDEARSFPLLSDPCYCLLDDKLLEKSVSEQGLPTAGSTRLGAQKGMGGYVKPIAGSAEEAALKRSRSRGATGMVLKVCSAHGRKHTDFSPISKFFIFVVIPTLRSSLDLQTLKKPLHIYAQALKEAIRSHPQRTDDVQLSLLRTGHYRRPVAERIPSGPASGRVADATGRRKVGQHADRMYFYHNISLQRWFQVRANRI